MFPLYVSAAAVSLSLKTSTLAMIQFRSVGEWKIRSLVKLPYVALAAAPVSWSDRTRVFRSWHDNLELKCGGKT